MCWPLQFQFICVVLARVCFLSEDARFKVPEHKSQRCDGVVHKWASFCWGFFQLKLIFIGIREDMLMSYTRTVILSVLSVSGVSE